MSAVGDRVEDEVRPTGRFRIYLGSAAGVGKTVAMIDEGCRRAQRGRDVVIGFVETHGRTYTAERAAELEAVPRKKVQYRGVELEEMDVDAVIRRKPEVALVDELAHTNVPGSGPHEKRWEDVIQILEADIAVVTTVNIQHLESIADAVEKITGVRVGERVPDWVVRTADQLELIDSSPEQLRRRMIHGNIYPRDKVPAALSGFFRRENLAALRELALRFVADETEEEIQQYLATHHGVVLGHDGAHSRGRLGCAFGSAGRAQGGSVGGEDQRGAVRPARGRRAHLVKRPRPTATAGRRRWWTLGRGGSG